MSTQNIFGWCNKLFELSKLSKYFQNWHRDNWKQAVQNSKNSSVQWNDGSKSKEKLVLHKFCVDTKSDHSDRQKKKDFLMKLLFRNNKLSLGWYKKEWILGTKTEKLYRNLGGNIYTATHSHTHTHQFLFKLKTKINEYHNRRVSKIGVWIWNRKAFWRPSPFKRSRVYISHGVKWKYWTVFGKASNQFCFGQIVCSIFMTATTQLSNDYISLLLQIDPTNECSSKFSEMLIKFNYEKWQKLSWLIRHGITMW